MDGGVMNAKKKSAKQIARMHEERNAFEAYLARLRGEQGQLRLEA
jgi:hypothetical protein